MDIMEKREIEIGKVISYLSSKTGGFENPKLIVIGGYALRHYIPFSRYSRDCDFVLKKGISELKRIKPGDMLLDAFEEGKGFGFMRWLKLIEVGGKKVKMGIDFMEGHVAGREGEGLVIDDRFLDNSRRVSLKIGGQCGVFIPSYEDLLILKILSSRKSDIRDIAALVWKNGLPGNLTERAEEVMDLELMKDILKNKIIPEIKNRLFVHSFRGTFITEEFGMKDQKYVIDELEKLV